MMWGFCWGVFNLKTRNNDPIKTLLTLFINLY